MDDLIRKVIRQEMTLGFQPACRLALDVEGGTTEAGSRYCWGFWDHEKKVLVPELQPAIKGFVEGIGVKQGPEWKGSRKYKLVLNMDCGAAGQYAIKSGLKTAFSRSLLNALAGLESAQLQAPVKIAVRPGSEASGKVVLPSLYADLGRGGLEWVRPPFEPPKDEAAARGIYLAVLEKIPEIKFRDEAAAA